MIDILIVTHGTLGAAFIETAKLIVGDTSGVSSIGFHHGDDTDELEEKIHLKIEETLKAERQLLIFADLLGGSPSNRTAMNLGDLSADLDQVDCLVGINLPMLLEAVMGAKTAESVKQLKEICLTSGTEGIRDLKAAIGL